MNMSLALRLPHEIHLSRSSSHVPCLPSFLKLQQNPHILLPFDKVHNPLHLPRQTTSQKWSGTVSFKHFRLRNVLRATTACTFSTCQLPKVLRSWCALHILTWKSLHNGLHFFIISTSKSAPTLVCFAHFDLEMCFTHNGVHFFDISTSKSGPSMVCLVTSKCASRHNGVQFFISHLARWLRTCRFSEPTFWPSRATNHWKNTVFRDFPTFSRTCTFFLLTLSLLWSSCFFSALLWLFPPLLFHLSVLLEVWRLNFLRFKH